MPEVIRRPAALRLACDDPSDRFVCYATTEGEPYRAGVRIGVENQEWSKELTVMLEDDGAKKLRDYLNALYPP